MKEKVLKYFEQIKSLWNQFLEKYNFINEIDKKFLSNYQKTLNKIEIIIKKIQIIVFQKENEKVNQIDKVKDNNFFYEKEKE
ncbi:hypothetical protein [Spiroplasma floricola]|uniref:Uncharacterized protein n=1 Tax=Spiroplasma floricola 23-6 TaxID=1336749 RepID=A0A2K8SCV8_9MOLU|nr:hypothetical protein [Spiroplasma floricola]AUB31282.1 hypothetical protein SFLOR_v1c02210 [Spiroplasma floricola 23-6]